MDVTIPQSKLRTFAYAVQCMSKIGKELFIEADGDQLVLRTLNDARSAFTAFYFQKVRMDDMIAVAQRRHCLKKRPD